MLASGFAETTVNDAALAEFLAGEITSLDTTLYVSVRRLPPACMLWRSQSGLRIGRYWALDAAHQDTGADAPEQFREILTQSVLCRLKGASSPATLLSGGLDSSAITAIAANNPASETCAQALSIVFDRTPQWSEHHHAEAVASRSRVQANYIDASDVPPFLGFDEHLKEQDGLLLAPGAALSRLMYRSASGFGHSVVLDGHGGDEVVSHGLGHLHDLARAGQWLRLLREARGSGSIHKGSAWTTVLAAYERYGRGGRLLRSARRRYQHLLGSRSREAGQGSLPGSPIISEEFALRAGMTQKTTTAPLDQAGWHRQLVEAPMQAYALAGIDRTAAAASVEACFPFWDRRLVEFCVSLPGDAKLRDGQTRWVLREAMKGVLPESVRLRRDKLDFTPHLARGLVTHHDAMIRSVMADHDHTLDGYVDLRAARAAWRRLADAPEAAHGADVQSVWRTVAFARWLGSNKQANTTRQSPRAMRALEVRT